MFGTTSGEYTEVPASPTITSRPLLWPLPADELGRHPFAPTPRDRDEIEAFIQARKHVEEGPAHDSLPREIGELALSQLEVVDGMREYDNRYLTHAPDDVFPKKLLPLVNRGNASIGDYLRIRHKLCLESIELGRYTTPFGLGHELIPDFHRYIRDGILDYNGNATLHRPAIRRIQVTSPAIQDTTRQVTAMALYAKLDHGDIYPGLPVREKQVFVVRFDEDSELTRTGTPAEREQAGRLRYTLTQAIRHEHDWRTPVTESTLLRTRVIEHILNEYVDLPPWIIPLSSTFYTSHTATVKAKKAAADEAFRNHRSY